MWTSCLLYASSRRHSGSSPDLRWPRVSRSAIVQLPRACDPPHTDAGISINACMQPASLENRLLQLCAAWCSSEPRTTRRVSFWKRLDVQKSTRCFRLCIDCLLNSASTTSWPCWRSRLSRRHLRSIWTSTSRCAPAHATLDRRPSHCCAFHFNRHHLSDDQSALTWNSLPPAVLNCGSLSTFKSRLKTHLFSTAFC